MKLAQEMIDKIQEFIKKGKIFYKDLIKKTEKRMEEWVC